MTIKIVSLARSNIVKYVEINQMVVLIVEMIGFTIKKLKNVKNVILVVLVAIRLPIIVLIVLLLTILLDKKSWWSKMLVKFKVLLVLFCKTHLTANCNMKPFT